MNKTKKKFVMIKKSKSKINMDVFKIKETQFEDRETYININLQNINKIIKSGWDIKYKDSQEWCKMYHIPATTLSAVGHLKLLLNNIKGSKLKCDLFKCNTGRAYYRNAISLASLSREIRQALCVEKNNNEYKTILFDYDLDNAHPNILLNLCKKSKMNKKNYTYIQNYCENREQWLTEISSQFPELNKKDSRIEAKKVMLKAMNQGHISLDDEQDITINVLKFKMNVCRIFEKLKEETNSDFYNECLKKKNNNHDMAFRSFVARTLQHFEHKIIFHVINRLEEDKIIKKNNYDYAFDGFIIEKKIDTETLVKYTEEIGFNLNWSIKQPTEASNMWQEIENHIEENKVVYNHPECYLNSFNDEYFISLVGDYEKMKSYWELFYTFVKNPAPTYYYSRIVSYQDSSSGKLKKQRLISPYSEEQIVKTYKHIHCNIKKTRYGLKKIPFLTDYIVDINKKTCEKMDFYPVNSNNPNDWNNNDSFEGKIYNTFSGYNDICFEPDIEFDSKSIEKGGILYNFLKVVKNVTGGQEEMETFLQIIADKIANPNIKRPFACLIKGPQGVGKNFILNQFSKIIGSHHYLSTANLKDITGDYAEGMMNKLIVNINEINFAKSREHGDTLKALISEPRMRFNVKYCRPQDQNVYSLIIVTTNNNNSIPFDVMTGERRWFVFESNKKNYGLKKEDKNGISGWKHLADQCNKKEFIQQLYLYLMTLVKEKPNYNFQSKQKKLALTEPYRKHCMYFIPPVVLFIIDYIKNKEFVNYKINDELDDDYNDNDNKKLYYEEEEFLQPHKTRLTDFCDCYRTWYKDLYHGNENFKPHSKKLKSMIVNLEIPTFNSKVGTGNYQEIEFVPINVLLNFQNRNFFFDPTDKFPTISKQEQEPEYDEFEF